MHKTYPKREKMLWHAKTTSLRVKNVLANIYLCASGKLPPFIGGLSFVWFASHLYPTTTATNARFEGIEAWQERACRRPTVLPYVCKDVRNSLRIHVQLGTASAAAHLATISSVGRMITVPVEMFVACYDMQVHRKCFDSLRSRKWKLLGGIRFDFVKRKMKVQSTIVETSTLCV